MPAVNANGPWVVQKYGGTSVGKFLGNITGSIVPQYLELGKRLALVCSARSGKTKSTGTTSLLLQAAEEALHKRQDRRVNALRRNDSEPASLEASVSSLAEQEGHTFLETIEEIRVGHLEAASETIRDAALLEDLRGQINKTCEDLKHFVSAAQVIEEISPKSRDIIIGTGEKLACLLVTAALRERGVPSEAVFLDDVVQDSIVVESRASSFLGQDFYSQVAENMARRIDAVGSKVAVVTGFFGVVPGSLLEQIGRGYSDLCAALCAAALHAEELQVWKEVDGIFTADPRRVPTARLLQSVTPEEAAELTYYGSEVIHPFTMEQAVRAAVPVRILNVQNPTGDGTLILPGQDAPSLSSSIDDLSAAAPRMPTAVTIKENALILSLLSNRKTMSHGFFAQTFGILDKYGIVVDLISTSEVHVSMAINGNVRQGVLDAAMRDLSVIGTISLKKNMVILSLVGREMRHLRGIAGKLFSTLGEGNINIHMISQGASEMNISCVITAADAIKALNLVHLRLLSRAD